MYQVLNYLLGFTDIENLRFPERTYQDTKDLRIYRNLINFKGVRIDVTNEMNERYWILWKLVKMFKIQNLIKLEGWDWMFRTSQNLKFYEINKGISEKAFYTISKIVEFKSKTKN